MSDKYTLIFERTPILNAKIKIYKLPNIVDLRDKINTIFNEEELHSSPVNALCSSFAINNPSFNPSRLFIYYNEYLKNNKDNTKHMLSTCIDTCKKYGICSEYSCPFDINKVNQVPSVNAYNSAKYKVINAVNIVPTTMNLKSCINNNQSFVTGIAIYESFESDIVKNTGYVPLPKIDTEKLLGAHACVCVGFNDIKNVWIMLNSFGPNWGDNGYFYLPYSYLLNDKLTGDIWKVNIEFVSKIVQKKTRTEDEDRQLKLKLKLKKVFKKYFKPINGNLNSNTESTEQLESIEKIKLPVTKKPVNQKPVNQKSTNTKPKDEKQKIVVTKKLSKKQPTNRSILVKIIQNNKKYT